MISKMFLFLSVLFVISGVKAAYDYGPLVPMSEYSSNWRVLDVWDCFTAEGKFCVEKDYNSMIKLTGSSNRAHGICCKKDYVDTHCSNDGEHMCSAPGLISSKEDPYWHTTNQQGQNYQIFAYNP